MNKRKMLSVRFIIVACLSIIVLGIYIANKHNSNIDKIEITMSNNIIKARVDETKILIPIFYPVKISDKSLIWSSTDTNIAVVDQEGLVTMKNLGTCKIYAMNEETSQRVECTVEVIDYSNSDFEDSPKYYDKYDSAGVMLNTRNIILTPENMNYNLIYKETPLGSNNGVSFTSSDVSVAKVDNEGRITGSGPGTCTITAKNNAGGFPIECKVTVVNTLNIGTPLESLRGETDTEKLLSAFSSSTKVTGNSKNYTVSTLNANLDKNLVIRNATFIGEDSKNILNLSASNKSLTFINCTFINVGMSFNNYKGTIKFERCTFKEWQYSPINVQTDNVTLEVIDCVFKDNQPNESEWIANENWERFWAYNPINIYGNNVTTKLVGNTFNNIMSRCVVYFKDKHIGSRIEAFNNTFYRTEGHVINIESPISGFVENNHFYLIGDLRNTIGNSDEGFGVGGNCVFVNSEYVPYCNLVVNNNTIRYAMENGIEGGLKEIAYNYIEYTGYRYEEGLDNPSMEGIWGSARNGIHDNVIINPNMDGIRVQNNVIAANTPCNIYKNIIIYNQDRLPKEHKNTGISVVADENGNRDINVYGNTIIGFSKISRIDIITYYTNLNIQQVNEYPY